MKSIRIAGAALAAFALMALAESTREGMAHRVLCADTARPDLCQLAFDAGFPAYVATHKYGAGSEQ